LSWVKDITAGLSAELSKGYKLHVHHMDTKRISAEQFQFAADRTIGIYENISPDIVVLCDDNALRLVGSLIAEKTPVVFCGINGDIRTDYPWIADVTKVTGVLERPLIQRTIIESNKALNMNARKAIVVLGASPTANAFFYKDLKSKLSFNLTQELTADVKRETVYQSWQQRILSSRADGYDILLVAGFYAMRKANNELVDIDEINGWLDKNSPIPSFTIHEQSIKNDGVIGGMVVNGLFMGRDAGRLVKQVMENDAIPRQIPFVTQNTGQLIFSESGLAKWNLNLNPLYNKSAKLVP